jgi:predicted DNA-binding transcriptional regulator AlpA
MTRFLTFQQLRDLGIFPSRQHVRRLIEQGILPKPFRLGDPDRGRLTWRESDIADFIERRAAARDQPRPRPAANNVVPIRRGRRPHYRDAVQSPLPISEPPSRPRFTADVGPRLVLRRPTR